VIVIQKHEKKKLYHSQFRQQMVDNQLKPNLITKYEVLEAFLAVEREKFVFKEQKNVCYGDQLIPLKNDRFLLPSLTFAKILQNTPLEAGKKVLVIGALLGYSLAIFLQLKLDVMGVDHDFFVEKACLENSYFKDIYFSASLIAGMPNETPFDIIFVEGGIQSIPANIVSQLKDGGHFAALIHQGNHAPYVGTVFQKKGQILKPIYTFDTVGYLLPDFKKEGPFKF
jgi:protein-L-isoaspartate(D-aspartate) O-methyltransferase